MLFSDSYITAVVSITIFELYLASSIATGVMTEYIQNCFVSIVDEN